MGANHHGVLSGGVLHLPTLATIIHHGHATLVTVTHPLSIITEEIKSVRKEYTHGLLS